jgi:hypothetical protein
MDSADRIITTKPISRSLKTLGLTIHRRCSSAPDEVRSDMAGVRTR